MKKKMLALLALAALCSACTKVQQAAPVALDLLEVAKTAQSAIDRRKVLFQAGPEAVALGLFAKCVLEDTTENCDKATQVLWSTMRLTEGDDDVLTKVSCIGAVRMRHLFLTRVVTALEIKQNQAHEAGDSSKDEWYRHVFTRIDREFSDADSWCDSKR